MMIHTSSELVHPPDEQGTRWFRFSLKTLLIVTALVAVYFAGRASTQPNWNAPDPGTWQMNLPAGHQRAVTLTTLPDGGFLLDHGTSSNLGGKYEWKAGQLQVVTPNDTRYMGLAWKWDGDDLVLVAEPAGRPSGATYMGTRLRFITSDTSMEAQKQVPVLPSRIPLRREQPARDTSLGQAKLPAFQPTPWRDPAAGDWELTLPAGFKRTIQLHKLPDGTFELTKAGVFDGTYRVRNDQLDVVTPEDTRMIGLAWGWQNDELVLSSEPTPPPTGARYLGARLRPVEEDDK